MAFQTGVYTSPANLLASLATFAAARGWTVHTTVGDATGGSGAQLSISSDGVVINLVPSTAGGGSLRGQPALTWVDVSTPYYQHTGSPNASGTADTIVMMNEIGTGVGTGYFFFGNDVAPRYIHVVAESTAGLYSHLSFGTIEKAGSFTGGGYLSSSSVSAGTSHVRAPFGGKGSNTGTLGGTSWIYVPGLLGATGGGWNENFGSLSYNSQVPPHFSDGLWYPGIDASTQRTPIAPIICFSFVGSLVTGIDRSQILGRVQDARTLSLKNRDPATTLVSGPETWRVFPWRAKFDAGTDLVNDYNYNSVAPFGSGLNGIAYREFA